MLETENTYQSIPNIRDFVINHMENNLKFGWKLNAQLRMLSSLESETIKIRGPKRF